MTLDTLGTGSTHADEGGTGPAVPSLTVQMVASELATGEVVEDAVARLQPEECFVYLRRLEQITELAGKWKRAIESRMSLDGRVGEHWTDADGHEFAFLRSSRGDFANPPELFADLVELGCSPVVIAGAISKMRVTDLREMAAQIKDDERLELVLGVIEDHRTKVQGAPRLADLSSPYRTKRAIASPNKEKES